MALTLNLSRLRLTQAKLFGRWWSAGSGMGTVTSVDGDGGTTGMTLTGGPIVNVGTLTLGGILNVANGGTGAADLTGFVLPARLINTTLPLAGGGDLSADRTLSIAITVANDGGAVAKQAATPGTAQTGHHNVTGTAVSGKVVAGTPAGSTALISANKTVNDGTWSVVDNRCTDTTTGAEYTLTNDTGAQGYLGITGSAMPAPGTITAGSVFLHSGVGNTAGMSLGSADPLATVRFYAGGTDRGRRDHASRPHRCGRFANDRHDDVGRLWGWPEAARQRGNRNQERFRGWVQVR